MSFGNDEVDFAFLTPKEVVDALTIDDVERFLTSLGVTSIERKGDIELRLPTICHNPIEEADNMKLYWYQNHKIFHCYTECGDNMSIFKLYEKFCEVNDIENSANERFDYIRSFITHMNYNAIGKRKTKILLDKSKYISKQQLPVNNYYPEAVLDRFIPYNFSGWRQEGISDSSLQKFNIRYWIEANEIIIPHYDLSGRLIGIRCREIDELAIDAYGKYHPIYYNNKIYNHSLGLNLYGIYEHQEAIRKYKRAIIVEGEKSVLLSDTYDEEDSVAVACCGHKFGIYQINLLTKMLGVNEIVIAFDKEYDKWYDDADAKKDKQLLLSLCNQFKTEAKFSFITDTTGLLQRKDSPFDRGKEVWENLYKMRIRM